MFRIDIKITRYYAGGGFYVDIIDMGDSFEAWLTHEDIGISELMFILPVKQPDHTLTMHEFVEDVENALESYKIDYNSEYREGM